MMMAVVICLFCMEIVDPQERRVGKKILMIVDPPVVEVQLESVALKGPGGPPGKIGKVGPVGARGGAGTRGEKGDKGDTGGVGQQGPIGPQGSTGPRGSQRATCTAGPKGDKGDPAVDIDIVAELCKHLPMERVEQYRRGAHIRYAINSM